MTRKKETNILVSQQDETQAQQQLAHYHHIADDLRSSENRQQAAAALSEINSMPEATQMALLKLLSKERNRQAADVLAAIHELSPSKNVRKEARRSLIRLEETKIYPDWTPPATAPLANQPIANPPRFWKGLVTQNRESGEVELVLCFEQGIDYNEVRIFVFLLDFWHNGISEFFTRTGTKRRMENEITTRFSKAKDLQLTNITLAEGRRLLEEALSINKWHKAEPNEDYRHEQAIVNQLIWRATDGGEDRGHTFINPELDPEQVAANFLGGWSLGDFGLAYDLLTADSNIREGLARDEWIERRRAWADEAHPARWSLGFIYEREPQQKSLWLPAPVMGSYTPSRKEVEVGWSLELATTPLSGTLREMPMGTIVNKPTGRHWFWTSYSLDKSGSYQESGVWRIRSTTDEGANAQSLSIIELQKHIDDLREEVKELNEEYRPILQNSLNTPESNDEPDEDVLDYMREAIWRMTKAMHYSDALIAKLPLDRSVYQEAANEARGAQAIERSTVYLDRLAQRFPEFRGGTLRGLASMYSSLKITAERDKDTERTKLFSQLAEQAARDAVAADHAPLSYILLAELLIEQASQARLDEAESLLHETETRAPNREEQTLIELGLGNVAIDRDQVEEALNHFQRAADISPDYPGIWYTIGHVQSELKHYAEAEQSLKRALDASKDLQVYTELASVYMSQHKDAEARATVEQGLRLYPQSAILHALLAPLLLEIGDRRRAQSMIDEAERLNPNLEMVKTVRQIMNKHKKK